MKRSLARQTEGYLSVDHFFGQLRITSLVPHEHFVHGHVQFRREVLGVGQGDLPVGEGSGVRAAAPSLDKVSRITLAYLCEMFDELLIGFGFKPVNRLVPFFPARRLPQVGQRDQSLPVHRHRLVADKELRRQGRSGRLGFGLDNFNLKVNGLGVTLSRQTSTP